MDGARPSRRSQAARSSGISNAKRRKCPRCLRHGALRTPAVFPGEGIIRKCLYCGHECGVWGGISFGRDVTPEPGVKADA